MFNLKGGHQNYLRSLAFVLCFSLIGCATPVSAPLASSILPKNGLSGSFKVHEYALVEESSDNPDHVDFQQRVPAVVSAQRAGWLFTQPGNSIQDQNQALAPFGFHLETNPTPPFSGYALYEGTDLIQRDIARFWPVSLMDAESEAGIVDFQLSFETIAGERLVASMTGIHPWPVQDQSAGSALPIDLGNQFAYVENGRSDLNLYTGQGQSDRKTSASDHIASDLSFGWQMVAGQPFYFYSSGDLVRLNYAGRDLSYTYDRVVHDNTGSTEIFNPGGSGRVAWFYAVRDGLWYYVEVGVFE